MAANFGRKLTRRDLPLIAQLAQGLGSMHAEALPQDMEESPLQQGGSLSALRAANRAQPTGSLADGPQNAVRLGMGMRTGGPGGNAPLQFARYAKTIGGRLMEGHDYGGGDVRWFARKNPAVLQAAANQAAQQQTGAPVTPAQGLNPHDEELLRLLLGNPTLRR